MMSLSITSQLPSSSFIPWKLYLPPLSAMNSAFIGFSKVSDESETSSEFCSADLYSRMNLFFPGARETLHVD